MIGYQGSAFVIDPGFTNSSEMKGFLGDLEEIGLQLAGILLTHAHLDHVFGVEKVRDRFSELPVYLHPDDMYFWENYMSSAAMFGFDVKPFGFNPQPLQAGETKLAGLQFETIHTPGHAPGHVSFYFKDEGILIAGDVLFRESVGRTDLYKGDMDVLAETIRTKLYTLPDETVVYPGHGPSTTVGHEKRHNPFVPG